MSTAGEFDLIKRYFQRPQLQASVPMVVGPGDDCAVLEVPLNQQLVVSADTLVSGVHFLPNMSPYQIAQRCLAANLSDLAAMGATPAWFTLCLTMPTADAEFLQGFSDGLVDMVQTYGISLAGGDTTKGPLAISINVMGWVPKAEPALTRNGAQVGDGIYVSGTLGDAAAGLACLQQDIADSSYLAQRFYNPTPRLAFGQWLLGKATSALDISDGLLQDLGHILKQSKVGARIDVASLPLSSQLQSQHSQSQCEQFAMSGGEDFELCFTLPVQWQEEAEAYAQARGLRLTQIGCITQQLELQVHRQDKAIALPESIGWQHF